MAKHWRWEKSGDGLAWLTFDKQGEAANTFSRDALEELSSSLKEIKSANPKGLIIRSAKDGFVAGADVEEFTRFKSPEEALGFVRLGWDVFQQLHELPFPTTAAINGFCMGGGLELALACRYRVALEDPKTRLAFPEVMLGIMPAWHGVQWLPKVVGPTAALDLLLTGKSVDARRAKRMGLVDQAVQLRIFENTARMVTLEAPQKKNLPLLQRMLLKMRGVVVSQARKQVRRKAKPEHYPAPYAILQLWEKYDGDPFAAERDPSCSISALFAHPTTANLIRIFFLQERLKSVAKGSDFKARHVHIVGAGVMGGDIAAVCAMRGLSVTLQDTTPERIAPAIKRAAKLFERRLRDPRRVRDALDRLIPDVSGAGAARADVLIEAIFENLEAKRALFAKLESVAKADAILASNTSSLRLADIATALKDPSRLVGIHFFNPVARMPLVEVVEAAGTDAAVLARACAFVRAIDKLPLPVKSAPGFLVNAVLAPYMLEAMRCVDEGIAPETVDDAMLAFGMPMGPIELADTVGLDIALAAGQQLAGATEAPRCLADRVARGDLGKKSGRGFYAFRDGKAAKGAAGTQPPGLAARLVAPLIERTRALVANGIVADADLAEAGVIFGTGFAPFTGGPLSYQAAKTKEIDSRQ